jgi:2-polyprenyl-6-methoxyphenol hydroxylase-like FAD-dependent oxidoreductase
MTRTAVVIVGAGPCGLTAACQLLRYGVTVRLLEAAPEPGTGSRAIQLWPPALEILRELDLLADAESRGVRVSAMDYHLAGGARLGVVLGGANEPLLLAQEQTTGLLEEALVGLGGRVERGMRVVEVVATGEGVTIKAHGPAGVELVEADWLIGADGVHSTVRDQLGIPFPGARIESTLLLAEGRIEGRLRAGTVHYFLGHKGSLVFAPMAGGRVRVAAAIPGGFPLTAEGVQGLLDERGPGGLTVAGLDTINTFTSAERIAGALRSGRCFLVGDAAHTHSPLGGQGLNLGLQDVHNLTWKLAGVITGRFTPAILDTYETERRRAAEQVVRTTSRMIRMFMIGPAAARVRNAAWRLLRVTGLLRAWFVPLLAGWRTHYPDVLVAAGARRSASPLVPRAGTRRARWTIGATGRHAGFRLLSTGRAGGPLTRHAAAVAARYGGAVVHEHHARPGPTGFLLLRPDGYVAASGTTVAHLDDVSRALGELVADGTGNGT